jgi:hypothetical protein
MLVTNSALLFGRVGRGHAAANLGADRGGEGPAFDSRRAVEAADAEADGDAARAGEWKVECIRQLLTEGQ